MKLCIDPGHGNGNRLPNRYDPGAVHGIITESMVVLQIGLTLNHYCKMADIPVWMTRYDDDDPCPLDTRVSRALRQGCTHFVSLHLNAAASPLAHGTETLYADDDVDDVILARTVQNAALRAWGLRDRGIKRTGTPAFPGRLLVLDGRMPGVLLEVGFLSNWGDRKRIVGPGARERRIVFAEQMVAALRALRG